MLDQQALADALAQLFASHPPTPQEAAAGMADAYRDYAEAATFGASAVVIADELRDGVYELLLAAIEDPLVGLPATFAAAWVSALTLFWLAVPVVGAQVGVTTGCPGAGSIPGTLVAVLANPSNTVETGANGLATALHTATMTVQASVSPPPGTVVPIA